MPLTAKLSKEFYDKFGNAVVDELVNWFNQVDATYKLELRDLNELNFARFDAKLEQRIAELRAGLAMLEARFEAELQRAAALKISDLAIGGREVMEALSVPPGPVVGQVLAKLLERVLDEPELNTRERLLDLVPEAARALSTGNPQP